MSNVDTYIEVIEKLLQQVKTEQQANIEQAAVVIADAMKKNNWLYVFGSGHSHMMAEELFYRAGGLVRVYPILDPAFMLHEGAVKSTAIERLPGYAKIILDDYPLKPYLEYRYLKRRLSQQSAKTIQDFVAKYGDTPLATRLLLRWLKTRARKGDWQGLVDNYFTNNSRKLKCQFATALYKTGQDARAHVVTESLWLTKRSLPKSCDQPIAHWRKAGQLSNELLWQRIKLSMQGGNVRLTRYLGKMLPKQER